MTIDGTEIGRWDGNELSKGINLAEITCTPQYQQSLSIMYLNEERCAIEKRLRQYMAMQYVFLSIEDYFSQIIKLLLMLPKRSEKVTI